MIPPIARMDYEAAIGLEIHAELKTRTKMFCDSPNDPDERRPNVNVCPICLGHPGTLPVANRAAVAKLIQVGLALNGRVQESAVFERKNYFYPDLPKGYQISQYLHPLVKGGYLEIPNSKLPITNDGGRRVRIQRIHLEEDTGRLIHDPKTKTTLVDFNRAGIPLMELVTEPDLRSGGEVRRFGEELQKILRYLGASDADMEKGQMRVEVNVSLSPIGSGTLGTKVELKNINSFRFAADAVDYETQRQSALLRRGEAVRQETRGWDAAGGVTVSQRIKEESEDYRYFPEPDLPPLRIEPSWVEDLERSLPELPAQKRRRFREEYRIGPEVAETIVRDRRLAAFFEAAVSELKAWTADRGEAAFPRALGLAANYLTTDIGRLAGQAQTPLQDSPLTPENFAELMSYLAAGRISSRTAKEVLAEMFRSGADPSVLIEERTLWQTASGGELERAVEAAMAKNPKAATDYRAGKPAALQFLVGRVMKEARGANPEAVRQLLEEKLK